MSTNPTTEPAPPTNSLGEVEPPIPDPDAHTREGEPDPDTLDQTPMPPPAPGDRDVAPAADRVLARAASFLGYRERGDNDTTFGVWYGLNHQPWCDMFVSYVFAQEGAGGVGGRFAYCPSHVTWFKQRGQWGTTPRRGAVVFFSWDGGPTADHVGLVDGSFGTSSVAGYRRWQQRLGFGGRDADGIPGMDSLRRLGAAHGFSVTG